MWQPAVGPFRASHGTTPFYSDTEEEPHSFRAFRMFCISHSGAQNQHHGQALGLGTWRSLPGRRSVVLEELAKVELALVQPHEHRVEYPGGAVHLVDGISEHLAVLVGNAL